MDGLGTEPFEANLDEPNGTKSVLFFTFQYFLFEISQMIPVSTFFEITC